MTSYISAGFLFEHFALNLSFNLPLSIFFHNFSFKIFLSQSLFHLHLTIDTSRVPYEEAGKNEPATLNRVTFDRAKLKRRHTKAGEKGSDLWHPQKKKNTVHDFFASAHEPNIFRNIYEDELQKVLSERCIDSCIKLQGSWNRIS